MSAGKHRWWPWGCRDTEGLDKADEAIQASLRDLGAVEQRAEHVDSLAARAHTTADALATERRINHFNRRIRDALGGKTA